MQYSEQIRPKNNNNKAKRSNNVGKKVFSICPNFVQDCPDHIAKHKQSFRLLNFSVLIVIAARSLSLFYGKIIPPQMWRRDNFCDLGDQQKTFSAHTILLGLLGTDHVLV
jgi:hypothetical protein